MGFTEAIRSGFDNYANFNGGLRPAYWWWVLFGALVSLVTRVLDGLLGSNIVRYNQYGTEISIGIISSLVGLALLLPSIAVLRRLHDTDRSGWWYLIVLIPILGWLVLLYSWLAPEPRATTGTARRPPPDRERYTVPVRSVLAT